MRWLINVDADTKAAAGVEVRYALQSDVDVGGVVAVVEHKEFHVRRSLRSTFHDAGVSSLLLFCWLKEASLSKKTMVCTFSLC